MDAEEAPLATGVEVLINSIVQAVHCGDDVRIRMLLEQFAQQADVDALLLLRTRLNENLPPATGHRVG
ncbi:hypothetical protein [Streptomyces sp. CB03238]|uniref:hypothetical protein n=1 Tax=Streptomyces sp. CB03238 TaxID=1907777 RepID=UPI0011813773|nr:hypothetical protein [Streptomyces sp. CB03238]